jgi:signal peptidase I
VAPIDGRIFESQPERGDVAVFRQPKNETVAFIKRIVGLPGDRIQVTDGVLRINDVPVNRSKKGIATATDGYNVIKFVVYEETLPNGRSYVIQERSDNDMLDNTSVYEVPPGHYFMMGDNRDNSRDSRAASVGMVPAENLIGRAERLFFSHNGSVSLWQIWKWPFAIRYGRLGDGIM